MPVHAATVATAVGAPSTLNLDSDRPHESIFRLGDELFFYDQNNNMLTAENPLETRACVRPIQPSFLSTHDAMGTSIFRLEPQQSHAAQKELETFVGDDDIESLSCEASVEEVEQLTIVQHKADKEIAQNEAEKRRLLGKPVVYGQVIQLFNQHFKKYLTVTGKTCYNNKGAQHRLQVNLSSEFVGYFRIMPRYRIRFVGDVIRVGDTVALQCVRPEGYLNVDYDSSGALNYEVYSHTRLSSWTMRLHYSSTSDQDTKHVKYTNAGQYVRFYHKEMESYLEAPSIYGNNVVKLKKHIINPLDPKETESPQAFWEIENVDMSRGSKVRWRSSIRIRHVATRAYLSIDPSNIRIDPATGKTCLSLKLVKDPPRPFDSSQDSTLFQLVPVSAPPLTGVPYGSFLRIKHTLTDCWMHAASNEDEDTDSTSTSDVPKFTVSDPSSSSLSIHHSKSTGLAPPLLQAPSSFTATKSRHQRFNSTESLFSNIMDSQQQQPDYFDVDMVNDTLPDLSDDTYFDISAAQDLYYHDCFSITLVDQDLADTFNYANEMMPPLQRFLCQPRPANQNKSVSFPIQQDEYESIANILKALIQFCTKSNEPDPLKRVGLPIEYHQVLVRDIGIVKAVIDMIVVPFNLAKRRKVREKLQRQTQQQPSSQDASYNNASSDEKEVTRSELLLNAQLKHILTLCYHLLRVFLIRRPCTLQEEDDDDSANDGPGRENQLYVFNNAGEKGIALFIGHLSYNVGATDMLIRLLEVVEQHNVITLPIVTSLIDRAIVRTRDVAEELKTGVCVEDTQQRVTCIRLLSALCQKAASPASHRSNKNTAVKADTASLFLLYRERVSEGLFNRNGKCLLQTKIVEKHVQIQFLNDAWYDLGDLLQQQPRMLLFIESLLDLVYSLSNEPHSKTSDFMSQCISREVCLSCLKNIALPCALRSKFCDLLRVLYIDVSAFEKVALTDYTIYTQSINNNTEYYPFGSSGIEAEFFQNLKRWIFRFLDSRHQEFIENSDSIQFLSSVLQLVHTQLRLGFFQKTRDVSILFRALVHVLDGRTDARNEEHYKYITDVNMPREWRERYVLTEKNMFVMNTKIQILHIFDLIFDLRLRVRMSKLANLWKVVTENDTAEYHTSPNASGLLLMLSVFEETELRDREESLMPILKDILKYQYAPLKEIAIVVMHRLFTDSQELFKEVSNAVVLKDPEQAHVYQTIRQQLTLLQRIVYNSRFTDDHCLLHLSQISNIAQELQDIVTVPTDSEGVPIYDESIYCRIFKSLDACDFLVHVLVSLLNISAKHYHAYVDTINACLNLLCTITSNDKELQTQFVLSNMDLLISLTELSPKIAVTFARLCSNNLYLSIHIKEGHIIRLLETSEGHQGEYLLVLHDLMKTQGKFIKRNQDIVMRFFMDHRQDYVPFDSVEKLKSMHNSDYCINLISILAICGQGENTFGQSFARTIFSIQDIYDIVYDEHVSIHLKSVMLTFLASIYIEDVELVPEAPIYDNENIAQMFQISEDAITRCIYTSSSSAQQQNKDNDFGVFVFGGVLAFLRAMFEYHISIEVAVHEIYRYTHLVDLVVKLLPLAYQDEKALQANLACLDSMINVAGFRGSMSPRELRDVLKYATKTLDKLNFRNHHHHHQEQHTTSSSISQLKPIQDTVNISFQKLFQEIKTSQAVKQYQQQEFDRLCSHFSLVEDIATDIDGSIESLIAYLSTMTTSKVNKRVEHYQVSTIKLLEDVSRKHIRQRIETDPNANPSRYEALEKKKVQAQNALNDLGCTLVAQNLLSSPRRRIFDAALKLLISLLDGGNKNVQDKLEEYFYSIREERFFYSFHQRLQSGISSSKDAQVYLTRKMYKMNRQQHMLDNVLQQQQEKTYSSTAIRRKKSKSISLVDSNYTTPTVASKRNSYLMLARKRASSIYANLQVPLTTECNDFYREISQMMAANGETTSESGSTVKDFKVMQDTMRTLQLMVEGHNLHLQMYLTKQPDNIKSFNIVLDVVEYFHAIVPLCSEQNIELIIQVLDTITELAQGCLQNQVTIFNNKIINPVNTILKEAYTSCDYQLVNELKSKVVTCLLSLLEGGIENSETIYKEMVESLDLATVKSNMDAIYNQNLASLNAKNVYEKLECGFLYAILVMTLAPAIKDQEQSAMFFERNDAFDYFQSHTGKIEILMDYGQEKQLTRVLFPVPEVCQYLRQETKQRFLWNVKRIENQAHVAHSKYLSFLTEYSTFWWESAYAVSILLNVLLMLYPNLLVDAANTDSSHQRPFLIMCYRYLLGLAHLGLWLLLTTEFYFIQLPVLINRRHGLHVRTFIWARTLTDSKFLYHILMVVFSAIGLVYPGFYSLHLLDFVFRDSILQGVISSITLNVHSISRTAILGIIVIYIHSIVAYMYFRKEFDVAKGLFCGSLMECFVTVLSHGVRSGGGIGDILEPDEFHKPSGWRTMFEMSFYLVVVVFLLNAIFGIIFDTFGHLRDERSSIQQDMKNSCFICSIPAVEFQRHAKKGFEDHIKNDHNIWQYLFFLVHLRNKDRTEYTGPESYVAGCLKNADYSFFPINRALGLATDEQDDTERLDRLEEMNQQLLDKLAKLEEHLDKLTDHQIRSRQNSFMLSPM
ncbi:conserved hypothetical protein [Mucor ambiguus]|uniref:MIR domain-containing protein n=1 Tax=Mucor ambiguus TaxID=91626 RepID=A0A0C9M4R7_9FUNG|nr:conserved hypothetical protein [Mucor ambiguus]